MLSLWWINVCMSCTSLVEQLTFFRAVREDDKTCRCTKISRATVNGTAWRKARITKSIYGRHAQFYTHYSKNIRDVPRFFGSMKVSNELFIFSIYQKYPVTHEKYFVGLLFYLYIVSIHKQVVSKHKSCNTNTQDITAPNVKQTHLRYRQT